MVLAECSTALEKPDVLIALQHFLLGPKCQRGIAERVEQAANQVAILDKSGKVLREWK